MYNLKIHQIIILVYIFSAQTFSLVLVYLGYYMESKVFTFQSE